MGILILGLVTGLLARSLTQLLVVAGVGGWLSHALPRIIDRSIHSKTDSALEREWRRLEMRRYRAAHLLGCIAVALAVMGVKSLFR